MNSKNNLVIIRNKHEIDFAVNILKEKIFNYVFIPISVEIIDDLIKKKLKVKIPQDFLKKLKKNYTKSNLLKFQKLSIELDDIIIKNIPEYKKLNIKPFRHSIIYNRHLINNNYALIDFFKNLINNKKYTKILFFFNAANQTNDKFKKIYDNLKANEKKKFIPTKINLKYNFSTKNDKILHGDRTNIKSNYNINNVKFYLKNFINKKNIYKNFKKFFLEKTSKKNKIKHILILSLTENELLPLLQNLKEKNTNIKFVFWDLQKKEKFNKINSNQKKIINSIIKNKDIFNSIKYKEIDLFKVIFPDIVYFIEKYISSFYYNTILFNHLNQIYDFKLILTQYAHPIFESIFHQCAKNKIPTVTMIHGGSIGFSESFISMNELLRENNNYKSLMCYTDQVKKFLINKSKDFKTKANFFTVGSSHFRNLKRKYSSFKSNKNKLKICLVLDPITNDSDGFYENHQTYIRALKTVEMFGNSKYHELFLKPLIKEDEKLGLFKSIKENKWNNIKILNYKSKFFNIINKFDFIILSYIGTPFFETSCSKVPNLTFIDEKKVFINKNSLNHIKSKSYVAKNTKDYLYALSDVKKNIFKSYIFNKTKSKNFVFFNKYCNPKRIKNINYATKIIINKISSKKNIYNV